MEMEKKKKKEYFDRFRKESGWKRITDRTIDKIYNIGIENEVIEFFKLNHDSTKALKKLNEYMTENINRGKDEINEFCFVERSGMGEYLEIKTTHLTRNRN